MNLRPQSIAAAAAVVALALGTAACGGSDDSSDSSSPSSSSSSDSSNPTTDTASSGGDLTEANFITTISDAQAKARSSHVSMDIGAGGQSIKAEGDVEVGDTSADTSMSLTMDMGAAGMGSLKMVLVDQVFYLNFGQLTANKYAKIDLADSSNPLAKQFGSITDQVDPTKQLGQFKDALVSFKKAGSPEKIDGVDAQPYEIVLDTSKIAGLSGAAGTATAAVPKTLTYTMYIGSDNLLRRMTADVAGSTIKADYTKWGEDVDVKAPPAAEITDKDLSQLGAAA